MFDYVWPWLIMFELVELSEYGWYAFILIHHGEYGWITMSKKLLLNILNLALIW